MFCQPGNQVIELASLENDNLARHRKHKLGLKCGQGMQIEIKITGNRRAERRQIESV